MPAAEGSIGSMVSQMPEQSLSGARLGQPGRHPVAMMLGCKYNQNRFRIETDGDITMENGYGSDRAHRYFFGMERWSRVANYTDPAPATTFTHLDAFIVLAVKELQGKAKTVVAINDSKHMERIKLVQVR